MTEQSSLKGLSTKYLWWQERNGVRIQAQLLQYAEGIKQSRWLDRVGVPWVLEYLRCGSEVGVQEVLEYLGCGSQVRVSYWNLKSGKIGWVVNEDGVGW